MHMAACAFRFGVVAAPSESGEQWRRLALRVEALGYATLLMPDGFRVLSPMPSLAIAAGVTSQLKVGTFVLASSVRSPQLTAWDAHTLTELTDGRFELGIGTGRPDVIDDAARRLGVPAGSTADRLRRLEETIVELRKLDGSRRTPVLMAASGRKARAVAAARADTVALTRGPLATRDEMRDMAEQLRVDAGERGDRIELAMTLFAVGDQIPAEVERYVGVDAATLISHDSLALLRGSTRQMADELLRRRDQLGVSYIIVQDGYVEQLAPVVELLAAS